jgi:D-serine deaminase-like pyridoxal phosphate-dependent protein
MRAGVHVLFDLVQPGLGLCRAEDITISVMTTVIGHRAARGWVLIDAGWMALAQDRGTSGQAVDQGHGIVCGEAGRILPDPIVVNTNQEHGIVARRPGSDASMPDLPVGTRLRILPNHACATAAQNGSYHVLPAAGGSTLQEWSRFGGWWDATDRRHARAATTDPCAKPAKPVTGAGRPGLPPLAGLVLPGGLADALCFQA